MHVQVIVHKVKIKEMSELLGGVLSSAAVLRVMEIPDFDFNEIHIIL